MDALSSSVSSLTIPIHGHFPTSRELYHFKNPNNNHHSQYSNSCKPPSICNKKSRSNSREFSVPFVNNSSPQNQKSPSRSSVTNGFGSNFNPQKVPQEERAHNKAASGYATALIDVARSNNKLEGVVKDVKRLSKWLRNDPLRSFMSDPFINEGEKGNVLMEIVEKGKLDRNLVVILKMLIGKNKLGLVNDVLQEFGRIYDELIGTSVVVVSSEKKMDKDELFGIAKGIQKLSGAIKVKVRHVFHHRLPSLAT